MRLGTQGLIICRHRCLLQGLGKYCAVAVELVLVPQDTENWLYSCRKERASLGRDLAGDEVSRLTSWQVTKIHSGCHVRGQYSDCRLRHVPSKQGINLSNLCYSVLMQREGRMTQVPCVTLESWTTIQYVSRDSMFTPACRKFLRRTHQYLLQVTCWSPSEENELFQHFPFGQITSINEEGTKDLCLLFYVWHEIINNHLYLNMLSNPELTTFVLLIFKVICKYMT